MKILIFTSFLVLGSCSSLVPIPEGKELSLTEAEKTWTEILKKHVDKEGYIDFEGIAKNYQPLKNYIRFLANFDAGSLKNKSERVALLLNAYNATAIFNVIEANYPEDFDGKLKRAQFFYFTKFILFKTEMSLSELENKWIRTEEDPRIHFALNQMAAGGPRLPNEPFVSARVDKQLEKEAFDFFNDPRNVRVDSEQKTVFVSELFSFYKEDFQKKYATLNEYINIYRKEKVPVDFKIDYTFYDWRLHKK